MVASVWQCYGVVFSFDGFVQFGGIHYQIKKWNRKRKIDYTKHGYTVHTQLYGVQWYLWIIFETWLPVIIQPQTAIAHLTKTTRNFVYAIYNLIGMDSHVYPIYKYVFIYVGVQAFYIICECVEFHKQTFANGAVSNVCRIIFQISENSVDICIWMHLHDIEWPI